MATEEPQPSTSSTSAPSTSRDSDGGNMLRNLKPLLSWRAKCYENMSTLLEAFRSIPSSMRNIPVGATYAEQSPKIENLLKQMEVMLERLGRKEITIMVIGAEKFGKSTLMNVLMNFPLLPTGANRCTGTRTIVRNIPVDENPRAEIRFFTASEFRAQLANALDTQAARIWLDRLSVQSGEAVTTIRQIPSLPTMPPAESAAQAAVINSMLARVRHLVDEPTIVAQLCQLVADWQNVRRLIGSSTVSLAGREGCDGGEVISPLADLAHVVRPFISFGSVTAEKEHDVFCRSRTDVGDMRAHISNLGPSSVLAVASVTIFAHLDALPSAISIIDTPGVDALSFDAVSAVSRDVAGGAADILVNARTFINSSGLTFHDRPFLDMVRAYAAAFDTPVLEMLLQRVVFAIGKSDLQNARIYEEQMKQFGADLALQLSSPDMEDSIGQRLVPLAFGPQVDMDFDSAQQYKVDEAIADVTRKLISLPVPDDYGNGMSTLTAMLNECIKRTIVAERNEFSKLLTKAYDVINPRVVTKHLITLIESCHRTFAPKRVDTLLAFLGSRAKEPVNSAKLRNIGRRYQIWCKEMGRQEGDMFKTIKGELASFRTKFFANFHQSMAHAVLSEGEGVVAARFAAARACFEVSRVDFCKEYQLMRTPKEIDADIALEDICRIFFEGEDDKENEDICRFLGITDNTVPSTASPLTDLWRRVATAFCKHLIDETDSGLFRTREMLRSKAEEFLTALAEQKMAVVANTDDGSDSSPLSRSFDSLLLKAELVPQMPELLPTLTKFMSWGEWNSLIALKKPELVPFYESSGRLFHKLRDQRIDVLDAAIEKKYVGTPESFKQEVRHLIAMYQVRWECYFDELEAQLPHLTNTSGAVDAVHKFLTANGKDLWVVFDSLVTLHKEEWKFQTDEDAISQTESLRMTCEDLLRLIEPVETLLMRARMTIHEVKGVGSDSYQQTRT